MCCCSGSGAREHAGGRQLVPDAAQMNLTPGPEDPSLSRAPHCAQRLERWPDDADTATSAASLLIKNLDVMKWLLNNSNLNLYASSHNLNTVISRNPQNVYVKCALNVIECVRTDSYLNSFIVEQSVVFELQSECCERCVPRT